MKTCRLWIADQYLAGCPPNRAPRQVGYGLTREAAIEACQPWANQAPWFRRKARSILVVDGEYPSQKNEDHVWAAATPANGSIADVDAKALASAIYARFK